jgi:hypothetical protein
LRCPSFYINVTKVHEADWKEDAKNNVIEEKVQMMFQYLWALPATPQTEVLKSHMIMLEKLL